MRKILISSVIVTTACLWSLSAPAQMGGGFGGGGGGGHSGGSIGSGSGGGSISGGSSSSSGGSIGSGSSGGRGLGTPSGAGITTTPAYTPSQSSVGPGQTGVPTSAPATSMPQTTYQALQKQIPQQQQLWFKQVGTDMPAVTAEEQDFRDQVEQTFKNLNRYGLDEQAIAEWALSKTPEVAKGLAPTIDFLAQPIENAAVSELKIAPLADLAANAPDALINVAPDLSEALAGALIYAEQSGASGKVKILDSADFLARQTFTMREEHLLGLGLSATDAAKYRDLVRVFPISVDGQTVAWIETLDGNDGIKSVGPGTHGGANWSPGMGAIAVGAGVATGAYGGAASSRPQRKIPTEECGFEVGQTPCFGAAVSLHEDGRVSCSGVLIAPRWVLTAAHCTCGTTVGLTASIGMTTPDRDGLAWAETASTIIRTEALRYPDLPGAEPVSNFCPTFDDWTRITKAHDLGKATKEELIAQTRMTYNQRDIALVQLSRDLKLPSDTEYAQIGDGALLAAVRAPYVAGFGQNDWQDRGGDKTVIDAIFPPDVCTEGPQSAIDGCQPDIEMRLVDANAGKTDSCAGDSGAGVYVPVEGGHIAVVGVVSRGAESGCGAGGIYALVTDKPVRDWIRKVIPSTGFSNRLVRSDLRLAN